MDPLQILNRIIDDCFYGSTDNKSENENAKNESMKHPTAKKLIEILEKESEYRLSPNFKTKYF